MDFRISDTFTESLARLTSDEQKAVKTTAFDLQVNPTNPGNSFHRLDKGKDKHFWSVRVSKDIRIIVHKTQSSLLLCYVNHHDRAYDWAARRKLEVHPTTGAAQLVQIRETVREVFAQRVVTTPLPAPMAHRLFAHVAREELMGYGVPDEWVSDVQGATEETLLDLTDYLPAEAAEALLELATGGKPRRSAAGLRPLFETTAAESLLTLNSDIEYSETSSAFNHPDAQRRFRIMENADELQRALEFPWDKWTVFLHPDQRQVVEREYSGPARVSGSAGTGKTIVALHRAAYLARKHPEARILLATFSDILANVLLGRLKRLVYNEPKLIERIDVHSLDAIGARLYKSHVGLPRIASRETVVETLRAAMGATVGHRFSLPFVVAEWEQVVDAWQLGDWEAYRDVNRLGRKARLPEPQRRALWSTFAHARAALSDQKLLTRAGLFHQLTPIAAQLKNPPFEFAVIDEAQDISIAQLRFLAALGAKRSDALFFAGDLGQRIFQQPFSWKALGVDIRGRSRNLRVNYRTSHQIRMKADRLLGPQVSDVDGNSDERNGTVSVFNGPSPVILSCSDEAAETASVAEWLVAQHAAGVVAHEIGVIVRSTDQIPRARDALERAGLPFRVLDENVETVSEYVSVCTMHLAKGLEFRCVAVMACDDHIIPLQERIETAGEESDLKEIYETERHLLYVACTRARDQLLVTSVKPGSEFLDDLTG